MPREILSNHICGILGDIVLSIVFLITNPLNHLSCKRKHDYNQIKRNVTIYFKLLIGAISILS